MKQANKTYVVNVGNIGNIYCTTKDQAIDTYNDYVHQSKSNYGRAAGESVVLLENDDIIFQHVGMYDDFANNL